MLREIGRAEGGRYSKALAVLNQPLVAIEPPAMRRPAGAAALAFGGRIMERDMFAGRAPCAAGRVRPGAAGRVRPDEDGQRERTAKQACRG